VPGNVLNVVVIPFRLQLPELHRLKLAQGNAGFEAIALPITSRKPYQPKEVAHFVTEVPPTARYNNSVNDVLSMRTESFTPSTVSKAGYILELTI
jgi:hypothetical protein